MPLTLHLMSITHPNVLNQIRIAIYAILIVYLIFQLSEPAGHSLPKNVKFHFRIQHLWLSTHDSYVYPRCDRIGSLGIAEYYLSSSIPDTGLGDKPLLT
jgi:hypothetical protein